MRKRNTIVKGKLDIWAGQLNNWGRRAAESLQVSIKINYSDYEKQKSSAVELLCFQATFLDRIFFIGSLEL